ncbi:MAG: Hpt domain-containing protein, partial [Actinomycetota bacterium]|nr:Hpt domain-containing protein [Actinomycetota bacterium]
MDQGTLLETFITEATELIQELEIDVVALEDSKDEELINRIFRAAHTIKGSGGLVGLTAISDFTHFMESVLDLVRQRELAVTGELVSVLLRAVDLLKAMIKSASTGESCYEQRELEFVLELLGQFLPQREERADNEETPTTINRKEASYFEIELKLSENLLETGTDPLMLFRELEDIGEIVDIVVDARGLPDVYNVDVHKLYLNWRLVLRTSEPFSSIENVFIFVQDDSEISITDVSCHFKDGVDLRVADM